MATEPRYRSLKGFRDLLPEQISTWHRVEEAIRTITARYGFGEIRLPIAETTELFARGIGEVTDVVGKEMYTFEDRSDPPVSITLRPELTAGAARAWVEHAVGKNETLSRWYYLGPAFRYEQPQAGRYRQFYTFGVELIGSDRPEAGVEVIALGNDLLAELGIDRYRLEINSLGLPSERLDYRAALVSFLRERQESLSQESRNRIESNPLRVLDSKDEGDREATADAPDILSFLGQESGDHFETVQELLGRADIEFSVNRRLVRGLDYYTRTVFEFIGEDLGAQSALGGGGRYDELIEQVGGTPTPATGFGFGIDRLVIALDAARSSGSTPHGVDLYLVGLDDISRRWVVATAGELRREGYSVIYDLQARSMKAQMREANRKGARLAVIVGENELREGVAQVRRMDSSEQTGVPFDQLPARLARELTPPDH